MVVCIARDRVSLSTSQLWTGVLNLLSLQYSVIFVSTVLYLCARMLWLVVLTSLLWTGYCNLILPRVLSQYPTQGRVCFMWPWPSVHSAFVHRNGRTARMRREGKALIMLTPRENSYVEFMRLNKGLTLQSYPNPCAPCVRAQARDLIAKDR